MGDPLTRLSVPLLPKPRRRCILVTEYDKFSKKDQIVVNADIEEISSLLYKKKKYRKTATLYIWISVFMFISGSALAHNSNSIIIKFLLVGSFGILFWGMGLYAVSKGYSRYLGFLLGLINWVGVIILFCLNDNDEQLSK
jgi:hypothetical protein